jgi:hypothetical protein
MARQPSDGAGGSSSGRQRALRRSESCLQIVFVRNKLITSCFFFPLPAPSFYPGYGGITSIFDIETDQVLDPSIDEPHTEDEEDWIDKETTTLPQGQREKAMAIEVCVIRRSLATMFDIMTFTETILDGINCYSGCWSSHIGKHDSPKGS